MSHSTFSCHVSRDTASAKRGFHFAARHLAAARRRGFTLVEILMATAVLSIVMVALCAAVSGTIDSVQVNQNFIESSNKTKMSLSLIERTVRNAATVVLTSSTRLDFVDEDGNAGAFTYDASEKALKMIHGSPAITSTLVRDITSAQFRADSEPDPETKVVRIVRLTIDIAAHSDVAPQIFSASVSPRRARSYQ
jgi:prepilin-type N-terminal cleavage/methylation domain-containing protein